MFELCMLPAGAGTSIWVQWREGRSTRRLLADGGIWHTYPDLWARIRALPRRQRRFELVVCSHIDGDHIDGLIRLLHDQAALGLRIGEFWFNGWRHLGGPQRLGPAQGEYLGALLDALGPEVGWNGEALVVAPGEPLPSRTLAGGMTVTVLSPFASQLAALRKEWKRAIKDSEPGDTNAARERFQSAARLKRYAGLGGGQVLGGGDPDPAELPVARNSTVTNASSVAVLLERDGSSALLTGDAAPEVLHAGVARLLADRGVDRLDVGALVVPHHGSAEHVTPELLERVTARRYLFSSDGTHYGHPHAEAVETVLESCAARGERPELVFNYRSPETEPWLDRSGAAFTATLAAGTPLGVEAVVPVSSAR